VDYQTPPAPTGMFSPPPKPVGLEVDANARTWGMIAHLSALAGYVIPLGNIIGPLVIWQIKKTEIPFAADQAKEALNFHIGVSILAVLCVALMCVFIGFILLPVVGVVALIFTILAGIAANKGEYYRYPFSIRIVK
jgi:uncharacterized Tic20 family protein